MSVAIGPSAASHLVAGHPSTAGLQAEITRYQQQLADCINCPSSKTPEGKANIQELSGKISADKARLHRIEDETPPAHDSSAATSRDDGTYTSGGTPAGVAQPGKGGLVNTYA